MVTEGVQAIEFTLPTTKDDLISLSDLRGKYIVLYFYPRDLTQGCTLEANDFRLHYDAFNSLNTMILGISKDSVASHKKFIEKCQLPFLLLSDETGEVCQAYDVYKEKMMFGKTMMGIERSTFIIDPEGKIIKVYRRVRVKGHVADVLQYIKDRVSCVW